MLSFPRQFLTSLYDAAVAAADPLEAIRAHLPDKPKGRTIVIGAGKAASQMAAAFERLWDGPLEGIVVAPHGPVEKCARITVLQAAHPVPDERGLNASEQLLRRVDGLTADDLVVALISGGGSALLPAPPEGLTLADEIAVNRVLLASGAPISTMNVVRKHISRIKGGRLALAAEPARVVSLIVSDVPGDNPALVASGSTVPDASTREEALDIIARYGMVLPDAVMRHLASEAAHAPPPSDPAFHRNDVHVIASAAVSLEAAAEAARQAGIYPVILSDAIEGEAREIARMHAAIARETALRNRPFPKPAVILSGGETTVTLPAGAPHGRGGRNTEFLLSFSLDVEGVPGVTALAADTDGIDGSEDNAGAFADGKTARAIREAAGDPRDFLKGHDAYSAFAAVDALFSPGPTGTNVNDFRAILVE